MSFLQSIFNPRPQIPLGVPTAVPLSRYSYRPESRQLVVGSPARRRDNVQKILNTLQSLEFSLFVQTLNAHWNMVGAGFLSAHELLKQQYNSLLNFIDLISEQIRAHGYPAPGSYGEFERNSPSGPEITGVSSVEDYFRQLIAKNQEIFDYLDALNYDGIDQGLINLLADLQNFHTKNVWMMRAVLADQGIRV